MNLKGLPHVVYVIAYLYISFKWRLCTAICAVLAAGRVGALHGQRHQGARHHLPRAGSL